MKKDDPKKMLPAVTITAKKPTPVKPETVNLSPRGTAPKKSVDSLRRLPGGARAVGNPVQGSTYGLQSSDNIIKMLKKK